MCVCVCVSSRSLATHSVSSPYAGVVCRAGEAGAVLRPPQGEGEGILTILTQRDSGLRRHCRN